MSDTWSSQRKWCALQVASQTDEICAQPRDSQDKVHNVVPEPSDWSLRQLEREVASLQTALRCAQASHAEALERCSLSRLEHQREVTSLVTQHANMLTEARRDAIDQEATHWRAHVGNQEAVRHNDCTTGCYFLTFIKGAGISC